MIAVWLLLFALGNEPEPVGRLVDVGGRRLHIHCTGSGAPTIVLDASGGTGFYMWYAIQPELSRDYRVCSYDRAGFGFSDPTPNYEKSMAQIVRDLHELLRRAGEKPPFVMAGHSMGGYFAWKYAERHPDEVRGVVLLDAAIPGVKATRPPEVEAAMQKTFDEAMAGYRKQLEEWRKNGQWGEMYLTKGIPAAWREKLLPLTRTAKWWETRFSPAPADYDEPLKALQIPGIVVVATEQTKPDGISDKQHEEAIAARTASIEKLFAPMPAVKVVTIAERHDFHEDRPGYVVEVIREVAQRARP